MGEIEAARRDLLTNLVYKINIFIFVDEMKILLIMTMSFFTVLVAGWGFGGFGWRGVLLWPRLCVGQIRCSRI